MKKPNGGVPLINLASQYKARFWNARKYLVAFALIGATLVAADHWLRQQAPPPMSPALAAAPALPRAPRPSAASPRDESTALETETVEIAIRVTPPGASLTVDGRAFPAGTRSVVFPVDDALHVLKVEAPGFSSAMREFKLDHAETLDVHLLPVSLSQAASRLLGELPKAARAPGKSRIAARLAPTGVAPVAPVKTSNDGPAKVDCDSPSFFDPNGIKRFRAECL
jgi:hypothetical protein